MFELHLLLASLAATRTAPPICHGINSASSLPCARLSEREKERERGKRTEREKEGDLWRWYERESVCESEEREWHI